jgi:hypothetical protein
MGASPEVIVKPTAWALRSGSRASGRQYHSAADRSFAGCSALRSPRSITVSVANQLPAARSFPYLVLRNEALLIR